MLGALSALFWIPTLWAIIAKHYWFDTELGVIAWFWILLCIIAWILAWAGDDDDIHNYKYKVQIGDKEFACNTISHKEDVESVIVTMDWVDSRVALDTNILISSR